MLKLDYYYQDKHLLELLRLYITKYTKIPSKRNNVKYLDLYCNFDFFDAKKIFVRQMNQILNIVDTGSEIAVVCH